jgi:diguanylate cyclase (GGDEF)-like protein/PAS domain S-box-containing protein
VTDEGDRVSQTTELDGQLKFDAEEFTFRTAQLAIALSATQAMLDGRSIDAVGVDQLFESSSTAMYLVGSDATVERANQAFAEFVGRTIDDVVGQSIRGVLHELDCEHDDPLIGRSGESRSNGTIETLCRFVRPDGEVVWGWLTIAEVESSHSAESGVVVSRLAQVVDVTTQIDVIGRAIAARQELVDREARYRSLVLPGDDPVLRVTADGVVIDANDAARLTFDFGDVTEHRIDELVPPAARTRLREMIAAAVRDGSSQQLERQRLRIEGSTDKRWFVIRVVPELSVRQGGSVHLVFGDVTGGVESERRLTEMALTDPLTGIANRAAVQDRLDHALKRLKRRRESGVAVVAIDIDNFKAMNDVYGHAFGDGALVQFARKATDAIRDLDTVGRLGGDEFLVILEDTGSSADARLAVERLADALNPFVADIDGVSSVEVSTSMGMAWTSEPVDASSLIAIADERLMLAKRSGRGRLWLPDDADADVAGTSGRVSRRDLILELRAAIDDEQFVLHYQPLVDRDDTVVAVEALIRWQHPHRGLLPPDSFVPLLIETGQMATVGTWVMEHAIAQIADWRTRLNSAIRLNINASAGEIARPEYRRALHDTLDRERVEPNAVYVELTEQALSGGAVSEQALEDLTNTGVNLVLDDFGTGISSLSHLRAVALSGVKIDRSFVSDTRHGDIDRRIVRGVTQLAHEVGVEVTAEGVETAEQSEWIRAIGCDYLQGYYFGRPVGADDIAGLVTGRKKIGSLDGSFNVSPDPATGVRNES